jgi:pilus assembly protein TadC
MKAVIVAAVLLAFSPWMLAAQDVRRRCVSLFPSKDAVHVQGAGGLAGSGVGAVTAMVDIPVVLELLAAALRSGAGIPRALEAAGQAIGGRDGIHLARVSRALRLGAGWDAAWSQNPGRLAAVARALRPAWADGASPSEALSVAADSLRRDQRDAARLAAKTLAVRLVLPLGACFLPAFVLIGLVPVLLALGVGVLSG